MPVRISIDTGGTFTDGIFASDDRIDRVKVDTTPHDLTVCFRDIIGAGAERLGLSVDRMLALTDVIRFSTTVGTNTIIQRNGIKIGVLVSKGYERSLYAGPAETPNELILPQMVLGLTEEISPDGTVVQSLDVTEVETAVESLLDAGARFLVVSLRNSQRNPAHEQQVKAIIAGQYPRHYLGSVRVLAASDITIRPGDFFRTNTAVLNAYLHPAAANFLYRAEDYLRAQGYTRPLLIAHSTGHVARVAKTTAVNTYNSGPVSGLLGARGLGAELYGLDSMITMDVGGTSLDVGVALEGVLRLNDAPVVDGMHLNIPLIEVETIGAGGGSIAVIDRTSGQIRVGPESAGAVPGPAAYDLGGELPTVTDADLVLGYISPDRFLGGRRVLDRELAEEAIRTHVADPLGISVVEAAWRIVQTVERNMATAIQTIIDRHGQRAAELPLFVYGGGGALRCAGVAAHLGAPAVYLFEHGSAFSALGADTLDVGHLYEVQTDLALSEDSAWEGLRGRLADLATRARRDMRGEGFRSEELAFHFEAVVRTEDGRSLHVALPTAMLEGGGDASIRSELGLPDGSGEGVTVEILRLRAIGTTPHSRFERDPVHESDPSSAWISSRPACCDGTMTEVPVFDRSALRHGHIVAGPAIVEAEDTTYWLPANARLSVDAYRNCRVEVSG